MRPKTLLAAFGVASLVAVSHGATAHAATKTADTEKHSDIVKTVVVEPGDTLSAIARDNHTTYVRLYDKNLHIKDPDLIYPDQRIDIPSADAKLAHRPLPGNTQPATTAVQTQPQAVAPAPQPIAAPQAVYRPAVTPTAVSGGGVWDRLAQCESGGNWAINTGNGFYGGLQFTLSSWRAVGGTGMPNQASKAEQIARAQMLQALQGWGAWPVCSIKAGLR